MDWELESEFDRLAPQVYAGARRHAVDREAAFDLACQVLADESLHVDEDDATALALACAEEPDEEKLANIAFRVLGQCFNPGFEDDPGLLAALEAALEQVNADMRATGLPGTGHLVVDDCYSRSAFVRVWDGWRDTNILGISASCGRDPVLALATVADNAQGAVMHSINAAWPVCSVHSMGVHAKIHDGVAVWWCRPGGHVVKAIGQWSGT